MIPVVGGAVAELWNWAQEMDRSRVKEMGEAARDAVGNDERFVRRLKEDERLLDMLVEAAEAARRTSWEGKRITMGRVLGQAMADDADIDDHAVLLSALAALEAVDFRILARVEVDIPMPPLSGHPVPEPYRSHLIAQGVVQTGIPYGGPGPEIAGVSDFGSRLLGWIRAVEPEFGAGGDTGG